MRYKRIGSDFNEYKKIVLPSDMSDVNVDNHRKTFYSGSASVVFILKRLLEIDPKFTIGELKLVLCALEAELNVFVNRNE